MSYNYGYSPYGYNNQNPMTAQGLPANNNKLMVHIQDDKIVVDTAEGPKNIGITWEAYQNLDAITTEYYEILKANDLLPSSKSSAEAINEELLDALKAIREEIKESKEERQQFKSSLDTTLKLVDDLTGGSKE